MLEALVMNFIPKNSYEEPSKRSGNLILFEKVAEYQSQTNG
jgi:hypothetical protein